MELNSIRITRLAVTAGLSFLAIESQAKDPLEIDVTNIGGGGVLQPVTGKSVPNLVEALIGGRDQFSLLQNTTFQANLRYADVAQALNFSVSGGPGNWTVNLSTPFRPNLISHQFNGSTKADVEQQLTDYLKKDGSNDLAALLKALNERSAFGVMTGNPNSTTALTAANNYAEYGTAPSQTKEEKATPKDAGGRVGLSMVGDAGFIDANGYKARSYSYTPFIPIKVASRVMLDVGIPLNYTEVEGSQVFRVGMELGARILLMKREYENGAVKQPWFWQVAPSGGSQVAGSVDLVAGGIVNNFGVTSLLAYDFGKFEISMGNHISAHESLEVTLGDYKFDPKVSTQIVKNGLKLGVPFSRRWYAEIYAIDTELLGDAAFTTRYTTVGGGVGFKALGKPDAPTKKRGYLMVGAYSHIGEHYTSANFQVGSGWKF